MTRNRLHAMVLALALVGCGGGGGGSSGPGPTPTFSPTPTPSPSPTPLPSPTATATPAPIIGSVSQRQAASFEFPWAMAVLPDGRLLVTERVGRLQLVTPTGAARPVAGVPAVLAQGQTGLHDVVLDPGYAANRRIWLSYVEPAAGGGRVAVARATLDPDGARLGDLAVLWRATPTTGGGHPGARLAFSPDGRYLFVSTGERQQGAPAQDLGGTLGKILRLNLDGTPAAGNPFAATAGARAEIWSYGHRNPYGLVFASDGRLFESEQGPAGGDEFNLIEPGRNYGWPRVSEGDNYDGSSIPRHASDPGIAAPLVSWTPVIAPGGMIQYRGSVFTGWTGDFILAGLSSQSVVRVRVTGNTAREVGRIALGMRIREVEEAPDGSIWVLVDDAAGGLVQLTPR